MKRILPIGLIVIGIALGIMGFSKLNDSGGSIEIGDLELSAEDSGSKNQAYVMLGGGALCLILGAGMMRRK